MNKPPRTNWNVADNKLKPIPPLYPPIPPNNKIFINDASPSVVACRISECLRKRSIIADYDDEAAVATCWSKGDNGSGEGELLLFHTGAVQQSKNNGVVMLDGKNNPNYLISGNTNTCDLDETNEDDFYDYGISSDGLTSNNYGGGGGCVVFSIHLYQGDRSTKDSSMSLNDVSAPSRSSSRRDATKSRISPSSPMTSSGYKYPYSQDSDSFPSAAPSVISTSSHSSESP